MPLPDTRVRIDGHVEATTDCWPIRDDKPDVVGSDFSVKVSLGRQLPFGGVVQRGFVADEALNRGIEVTTEVILDAVNDKTSGEFVATGNTLDETTCSRHLIENCKRSALFSVFGIRITSMI